MSSLVKWQIVSFVSRGIAMALGLVQTFVIIRILSVGDWGIVQLAISIGGAFGIYQHLGLASGSTREISSAKSDTDIFKIFLTSVAIRYLVTFPLAAFLFFSANNLALTKYNDAALILPIKLYAGVLVLQGVQSILNSVISGTKRFRQLFIYQAAIAVVSVVLFIPFVYFYGINGYFYAFFAFNLVSSLTLAYLAFKPLKGKLVMPTKSDFKLLLKDLLSISLAIYAIKILYTWWEKSGPLLLGLFISKEMVAFFAFALLYAKKFMLVSDSVTAVNLPVLSDKYANDIREFKALFLENFNKVYTVILLVSAVAIFWAPEVVAIMVGSSKYDTALPLIFPLGFAFVFYALINVVTSSILIPAKLVKHMLLSYALLLGATVGAYFVGATFAETLSAMAYAMLAGGFAALAYMAVATSKVLKFSFLRMPHFVLGLTAAFIAFVPVGSNLLVKTGSFIILLAVFLAEILRFSFFEKADLMYVVSKLKSLRGRYEKA